MYGSSLRLVTRTPREARIAASDAAAMPFPSEETTPPVTKTNLVIERSRKSAFYRNVPTRPNVTARRRRVIVVPPRLRLAPLRCPHGGVIRALGRQVGR